MCVGPLLFYGYRGGGVLGVKFSSDWFSFAPNCSIIFQIAFLANMYRILIFIEKDKHLKVPP